MVLAGLLLLLTGRNAFWLFWQALDAIFGSQRGIEGVALRAIPILMTALGVALSLRMKVWNIGSDGQFLVGALAAVGVGIHMGGPGWLVLVVMAGVASLAGRGLDPGAGVGPRLLERQRDHHDAAVELRGPATCHLGGARVLAGQGGRGHPVPPRRCR